MQSRREAKALIQQIAQEKRKRLEGGGPDFRGSLKRLVDIWPDPSQSLIELLQNADDAGASSVEYGLHGEGIVFDHNGTSFTDKDVWAICSVDASTKDAETHTGFMGIGFKAVFKLSQAPHVFNEPYRFRFSPDASNPNDWGWILVPKWIEAMPSQVGKLEDNKTIFWLPYKGELADNHRKRIEQAILKRFDSLSLMFLRKVQGLFVTKDNYRVRELLREGDTVLEVVEGRKDVQHRYKLFGSNLPFEVRDDVKSDPRVQDSRRDKAKIRNVELAFGLDAESNLRPLRGAKLYVFLPTEYSTGLRFAVQGDFILATGRSEVDETLGWNRWLWRCAGEVLQKAVGAFKNDERYRYQFYRVLPVRGDDFPDVVREEVVEPFWEWCKEYPIIISSLGDWVKPNQAVIASRAVQGLLDADKLEELAGRRYFVHPDVAEAKTFLTEVGATELEESRVLEALEDREWVERHDARWFTRLYHFLWDGLYGDYDERWKDSRRYYDNDEVRKLPIIRTSLGTVKPAREVLFAPEASVDAVLAGRIPGIIYVDERVLDEKGRELLTKWGVRKFETESVSRVILRGFQSDEWESWSPDQLDRCVGFLRDWLRDREWQAPPEFRPQLGAVQVRTQSGTRQRVDECYFWSPSMERLCPDGPFVVSVDDEEQNFLVALGVTDKPRIREFTKYYDRWNAPKQATDWEVYYPDAFCDRLREYWTKVVEITQVPVLALPVLDYYSERDVVSAIDLLKYLLRHWDDYYIHYTTATYRWRYNRANSWWRTDKKMANMSYFAYQLHSVRWLPTTKGLAFPYAKVFVPCREVKEVAGDLATYVLVPEGWDVDHFVQEGKSLFSFLGLRDKVDIKAASHLLKIAQEFPIDDNLRDHLARLYRHVGWLLAEKSWGQPSLDDLALLTVKDEFKPAAGLIWNDDPAIGQHFIDSEELDFVWVPTGVERYYLEKFFGAAHVKRLSTSVERQLVTSGGTSRDNERTKQLQYRARHLWSLLVHYHAPGADEVRQQLPCAEVFRALKIEVLLQLGEAELAAEFPVFYDNTDRVLFLTQSVSPFEIAGEFCRVFGLSFDHVAGVEAVIREDDLEQIELRFEQQGISLLDWDEQPLSPLNGHAEEEEADEGDEATDTPDQSAPEDDSETQDEEDSEDKEDGRETTGDGQMDIGGRRGGRGGKRVQREVLPYEERMRRESFNIERIIAFEATKGRQAQDVSREYRGYDILSVGKREERHIEVKSSSYVWLTSNEFTTAQEEGDIYWLYVVDEDRLCLIKNPTGKCETEEVHVIDTRWKIGGWREAGEQVSL